MGGERCLRAWSLSAGLLALILLYWCNTGLGGIFYTGQKEPYFNSIQKLVNLFHLLNEKDSNKDNNNSIRAGQGHARVIFQGSSSTLTTLSISVELPQFTTFSMGSLFKNNENQSQGVLQYLNVTLEINPPVCLFAGQEIMTNLGHISPQIERQNNLSNVRLVSPFTDMILILEAER